MTSPPEARLLILNENIDPEIPGDVTIFLGEAPALAHVEPWYAREPHLIVDDAGQPYRFREIDGRLVLDSLPADQTLPHAYQRFLEYFFEHDKDLQGLDCRGLGRDELKKALGLSAAKGMRLIRPKA